MHVSCLLQGPAGSGVHEQQQSSCPAETTDTETFLDSASERFQVRIPQRRSACSGTSRIPSQSGLVPAPRCSGSRPSGAACWSCRRKKHKHRREAEERRSRWRSRRCRKQLQRDSLRRKPRASCSLWTQVHGRRGLQQDREMRHANIMLMSC